MYGQTHSHYYGDLFPTFACVVVCQFHRHRHAHGVQDDHDDANGHADVGDPGDDGGDREGDGGGVRDPDSDDDEGEDEQPNADDHEIRSDEFSHSCVSDRVTDCRTHQKSMHHRIDPSAAHTARRHIRRKMDNPDNLSEIQMMVGEPVRDDGDAASFLDHDLFGDHPAGVPVPTARRNHHHAISSRLPRTASWAPGIAVHQIFSDGNEIVQDVIEGENHNFGHVHFHLIFSPPAFCSDHGSRSCWSPFCQIAPCSHSCCSE